MEVEAIYRRSLLSLKEAAIQSIAKMKQHMLDDKR